MRDAGRKIERERKKHDRKTEQIVADGMRAKIKSDKKFYSLKENITKLADQLKEEKSKSRVTIAKLMEDAEVHVKEAHDLSLAIAHSK